MSRCLRCGAGSEWLEGDVPKAEKRDSFSSLLEYLGNEFERISGRDPGEDIPAFRKFLKSLADAHRAGRTAAVAHKEGD